MKTMTMDNGGELSAHGKITEAMKETAACFADPCHSRQKGTIGNADRLIRRYVPEGTGFNDPGNSFPKKVQARMNARPRKKLRFPIPKREFFKHFL